MNYPYQSTDHGPFELHNLPKQMCNNSDNPLVNTKNKKIKKIF